MDIKYFYRPVYKWNPLNAVYDYSFIAMLHVKSPHGDWMPVEREVFPCIEKQNELLERFPPPEEGWHSTF
jgi:hypothetical protein